MVRNYYKNIPTAWTLAALAAFTLPVSALAQRVWTGEASGSWMDPKNWDGQSAIPAPGLTDIHFGAAKNYDISERPGSTAAFQEVSFGTWTFRASAGQNYSISGGNGAAGITVEYSPRATNHTIHNRVRLVGRTVDVQDPRTSLTLNEADWAGHVAKTGRGTLIITKTGANPGVITVAAGVLDLRASQGLTNGALRFAGDNPDAVVINSTGTLQTLGLGHGQSASPAHYAGSITGNLGIRNGQPTANSGVTQIFSGNNSYRGPTNVHAGALIINGTHIGGGDYQVASRTNAPGHGILGGSGMIELADSERSFTFAGGGADRLAILRPGESETDTRALTLGSALVPANVSLNAYSQLQVDLGSQGVSDSVNIIGSLYLDAGSSLTLNALPGAWDGSTYTIATYSYGLSGRFGTVNGLDPRYRIHYGANAITLTPNR